MIAEAVLLDALQAVHSGRLRVHEAYRTIRAAEPALVWDRDAAREALRSFPLSEPEGEFLLDALEGCVRPAPAQTDTDFIVWGWKSGDDPGWVVEGSYSVEAEARAAAEAQIGRYKAVRLTRTVWIFGELS